MFEQPRMKPVDSANAREQGLWNYDEQFKMACAWLEADGRFVPTAFIKTPTKTLVVVLEYDDSQGGKARCYRKITELARLGNAQSVTLVSDTWVGSSSKHRPSEDPDRREAVVVQVISPDGQVKNGVVQLYHRVRGTIVWDEQYDGESGAYQFLVEPWAKTTKTT
jgi:hypothetical protein